MIQIENFEAHMLLPLVRKELEDTETALIYGDDDFGSLGSRVFFLERIIKKLEEAPPQPNIMLTKKVKE